MAKTQFTRFRCGVHGRYNRLEDLEICEGESQTIPNQTIPLSELVMRYQQGMPLPRINDVGQWQQDDLHAEPTFDDAIIRPDVDITEVSDELMSLNEKKRKQVVADLGNTKRRSSKSDTSTGEKPNGEEPRT